jgi:hypothetical protein
MYDREFDLKIAFNKAVVRLLNIEERDYYSGLTTEQMIDLKTALANINNIITIRLAFSLAGWICNRMKVTEEASKKIFEIIRSSKPNSNGFDIELSNPDIVAEVKCNIPVNGGQVYGAAQQSGLSKDIAGLLKGKKKSPKKTTKSIKILGLYDTPEVRVATDHFVKHLAAELDRKLVIEPQQEQNLDSNHVCIVFVK